MAVVGEAEAAEPPAVAGATEEEAAAEVAAADAVVEAEAVAAQVVAEEAERRRGSPQTGTPSASPGAAAETVLARTWGPTPPASVSLSGFTAASSASRRITRARIARRNQPIAAGD